MLPDDRPEKEEGMPRIRTAGFLIRRLQQLSVAWFHASLERANITPFQYTILIILEARPGIDQIRLAAYASMDASTVGNVVRRLDARGLLERNSSPSDQRSKILTLTSDGLELLNRVRPQVEASRKVMLSPLSPKEQSDFLQTVERLLAYHDSQSDDATHRPWQRELNLGASGTKSGD